VLDDPVQLYARATRVDRWPDAPVILEGEVARPPEPERWRCPTCAHTFDRDASARSAYCLGGHRGERRHPMVECEAER
jgi:hypothetical protein